MGMLWLILEMGVKPKIHVSCVKGASEEYRIYFNLVRRVFPRVKQELKRWRERADRIPSVHLRKEAKDSLERKAFHCYGGAVLSLFNHEKLPELVKAIVAIQTVSDYLDNLSDRALSQDDEALSYESLFRLHGAMLCALDPHRPIDDFYKFYRRSLDCHDGGYLGDLVDTSRGILSSFRHYPLVMEKVLGYARLYSELQSRKHLRLAEREESMKRWFLEERERLGLGELTWWEFGAASGSTLGIFCLIGFSSMDSLNWISRHERANLATSLDKLYFPSITGLHILLDYLIDLEEDRTTGDLNFVEYYPNEKARSEGIERFLRNSLVKASVMIPAKDGANLPLLKPWLHRAVVKGLLAMYLSDDKAFGNQKEAVVSRLLSLAGPPTSFLRLGCAGVRLVHRF